jgi:hypothetical protein
MMSKHQELKNNIDKIIEGLKSGTIDLGKAGRIINYADRLIQLDKLTVEEHKIREEDPPDYLLTEQQIEDIESMINLAKKEIEDMHKT